MKLRRISAIVSLLSAFPVLLPEYSALADESPGAGWAQWKTPEGAGFDTQALEAAHQQADALQSAAVMTIFRGRVLVAWGDVERKLELHSVRKSLYSALWGIAVERGLVDLEATLADLGIDDLHQLTVNERQAHAEHLLQARSGVYHAAAYAAPDEDARRPARGSHPPGTSWYYNNWDFNVAGALLERITGKPLGVLFDEWIARPIGMEDYQPRDVFAVFEPSQSQWPALTFRMSTRDLARFGQLWLDRGEWKGHQVIPAAWIDRASHPATEIEPGIGYAMMWWTYEPHAVSPDRYPNASRHHSIQAIGTGGQAVVLVPERELVVVHRGDTDHGRHVSERDLWGIVDRVLGTQRTVPNDQSRSVPMQPVPFESQLPRSERPQPLELTPHQFSQLTGRYEFSPRIMARVFLFEGRLFGFMTGQQREVELLARSHEEFFVWNDPSVAVRFKRDESGTAYELLVTLEDQELVGRRVTEAAGGAVSGEAESADWRFTPADLEGAELSFTLPDLEGNLVSETDPRFEGKVLIVDLWGTWCPPCREMTPFLNGLHSEYGAEGLEIVGIAFEYQRDDGEDPRAPVLEYVAENGIEHEVLYGGAAERPSSLVFSRLLLPEFDGFPTAIVLARDGTVRAIEQGFDDGIADRLESLVRRLLAEDS